MPIHGASQTTANPPARRFSRMKNRLFARWHRHREGIGQEALGVLQYTCVESWRMPGHDDVAGQLGESSDGSAPRLKVRLGEIAETRPADDRAASEEQPARGEIDDDFVRRLGVARE